MKNFLNCKIKYLLIHIWVMFLNVILVKNILFLQKNHHIDLEIFVIRVKNKKYFLYILYMR